MNTKFRVLASAAIILGACLQFGCNNGQNAANNDGGQPPAQQSEAARKDPAEAQSEKTGEGEQTKETAMSEQYRSIIPFSPSAPKITKYTTVRFETSQGNIDMEIYPEAAPNAAKRFIELVKIGYYDNTPIFRVVKQPQPFVAQFGINWRKGMVEWKDKCFDDDPTLFQLGRGTLAFAKAGPNTNSTQVFINYGDNSFLKSQCFSTFGKITKGMEIADQFKSVGSPDMGLDQGMLWMNGDAYLKSLPASQQPTMIVKAYVVEDAK